MKCIKILFLFVGFGISYAADEIKEEPKLLEMVKERDQAIQKIVRSKTRGETKAERKRLKIIVGEAFDYAAFSQLSLGRRDWEKRTKVEKLEFIDLNRRLIERNYADPKLYKKADKIEYLGLEIDGINFVVKTVVHYKSEKSSIDYKLHQLAEEWLIYDMIIDDLSLSKSNRAQFRREIRKSSYEGLLLKLKGKLEDL